MGPRLNLLNSDFAFSTCLSTLIATIVALHLKKFHYRAKNNRRLSELSPCDLHVFHKFEDFVHLVIMSLNEDSITSQDTADNLAKPISSDQYNGLSKQERRRKQNRYNQQVWRE